MSAFLERLFCELLDALVPGSPITPLAASSGEQLPENFAVITATDPSAPETPPGLTWSITLSVNLPIDRRSEAEAFASAFLSLSLRDIAECAVALYPALRPGHLYAWEPGLSETDLTDGDRLILTANATLTCVRFAIDDRR